MPRVHSFIYPSRGSFEGLQSTTVPFFVTSRCLARPVWQGDLSLMLCYRPIGGEYGGLKQLPAIR
jgi:hypothetical protein